MSNQPQFVSVRAAHHRPIRRASATAWANRLPWLILPLLFLPNLGLLVVTRFGTLEISDFFIWAYLGAGVMALATRRSEAGLRPLAGRQVRSLAAFFVAWAFLSTVTMAARYGYGGEREVIFGVLKLAKFTVYGLAGWLTIKLVGSRRGLDRLLWSLTAGGLITASALPFSTTGVGFTVYDQLHGFKTVNAVSVEMAILISFLGVAWSSGWGGRWWQKVFPFALGAMMLGFAFSRGRGGWLAALIGLGWYLYRTSAKKKRTLVVAFILILTTVVAYYQVPEFHFQVTSTLNPDQEYLEKTGAGILGIDEGARRLYWWQEGRKLIDAPILGRGFFNRFPASGLDWVGSHNFWIQMFLETGIPGGAAMLGMLWVIWRGARRRRVLAVEVGLLVAFMGGMGGEYFYGGMPLLVAVVVIWPLFIDVSAVKAHLRPRGHLQRRFKRLPQ